MRDSKKKLEAQEMLIVHRAPLKPDPGKAGRDHGAARSPAAAEELELLRKRVSLARDPREKRQLIAEIQRRFGDETAGHMVQELRQGADDMPPPARKGKP